MNDPSNEDPIIMEPFIVSEDRIPTGPGRTIVFLLVVLLLATLAR